MKQLKYSELWRVTHDKVLALELKREIAKGHPLWGVDVIAIAIGGNGDDVLFEIPNGKYAYVHLTWRKETKPDWPHCEIFENFEKAQEFIDSEEL